MIKRVLDLKTLVALLLSLMLPLLAFAFLRRKTKIIKVVLVGYVFVILLVTLLLRFSDVRVGLNLVPFWSYRIKIWPQIIQNYLLFVPFGFFVPFENPQKGFAKTVFWGFLLSVGIEASQFSLQCGFCEIDDVIGNTLGTAIGFGLWKAVVAISYIKKEKSD